MTEKHGGSSFNSNHGREEKWWKNVRCGRLSESSETSPFHPTFFKSDRLRSLQFREKSHASFCYPPSLTGPVCRTKFTFSLRSNSFWRACVREYSNSSRTIQLCRARDISDIQTWRGIAFWYCFHHNGKHNVEMIRDKENGIARDGMISRNFPISTFSLLYHPLFVILIF